jgi:hypothetical protein
VSFSLKAVNLDLYSGHPITTVLQPKWPYRLRRDIITILRPNLHRTGHHTGFSVRTVLAGHILTDPSSRSSAIPPESSSRSHNRPGCPCGYPPKKKPCCSRARRTSRADCLRPVRLCCRGKGTAQNSADCSRISHISFLSTVRICLYGLCTI